jgi:hypothetical protein
MRRTLQISPHKRFYALEMQPKQQARNKQTSSIIAVVVSILLLSLFNQSTKEKEKKHLPT